MTDVTFLAEVAVKRAELVVKKVAGRVVIIQSRFTGVLPKGNKADPHPWSMPEMTQAGRHPRLSKRPSRAKT